MLPKGRGVIKGRPLALKRASGPSGKSNTVRHVKQRCEHLLSCLPSTRAVREEDGDERLSGAWDDKSKGAVGTSVTPAAWSRRALRSSLHSSLHSSLRSVSLKGPRSTGIRSSTAASSTAASSTAAASRLDET